MESSSKYRLEGLENYLEGFDKDVIREVISFWGLRPDDVKGFKMPPWKVLPKYTDDKRVKYLKEGIMRHTPTAYYQPKGVTFIKEEATPDEKYLRRCVRREVVYRLRDYLAHKGVLKHFRNYLEEPGPERQVKYLFEAATILALDEGEFAKHETFKKRYEKMIQERKETKEEPKTLFGKLEMAVNQIEKEAGKILGEENYEIEKHGSYIYAAGLAKKLLSLTPEDRRKIFLSSDKKIKKEFFHEEYLTLFILFIMLFYFFFFTRNLSALAVITPQSSVLVLAALSSVSILILYFLFRKRERIIR